MNDSEKPFVCDAIGCNMSFINEDHLTVHKRKHDMMLNLGISNKSNFFIADQTPTPTRFIRNSDEVELFQDLPSDNPFEETFRRAVAAGKNGIITVLESNDNDDALHTSNVFSHTEEFATNITAVSSENPVLKSEIKTIIESSSVVKSVSNDQVTLQKGSKNNHEHGYINFENKQTIENNNSTVENLVSADASFLVKQENKSPVCGTKSTLLLTHGDELLTFVAALKPEPRQYFISTESQNQNTSNAIIIADSYEKLKSSGIQKQMAVAKTSLQSVLTKNGTSIENSSIQNIENEYLLIDRSKQKSKCNIAKKQAILERNRASSMRARAKRKVWIEQLQQSLRIANESNVTLQTQVKIMQAQITKLKTLLLAHKDCPVTKAMEGGNKGLSTNVLTIKPNHMLQVPISDKPIKCRKRIIKDKLIIPKNPIVISSLKNVIILPKSESNDNIIPLHRNEKIKQIPIVNIVTPYYGNNESGKKVIDSLQSDFSKVSSMQHARLSNKNFNENAASKTTGT